MGSQQFQSRTLQHHEAVVRDHPGNNHLSDLESVAMAASQEPSSPSQMLSLEEAASELRISIDSLLDLCVTGKLICFRVGYAGEVLRVIRRDLENCRRIVALPQEPHHV